MTWSLAGLGLVLWQQVVEEARGLTCAWGDYAGFHVGAVPQQAPPYTHLWGWSQHRLLRARVEGDQAIVGLLSEDTPDVAAVFIEQVQVHEVEAELWNPADRTVREQETAVLSGPVQLVYVLGAYPLTFVRGR